MLFWLFIILLAVGILMYCLTKFRYDVRKKYPILDWLHFSDMFVGTSVAIIFLSTICVVSSLVVIVGNHITANANVAQNKERYESLCYKLESENARDEFGLLNKEIIDEIQHWNEDLACKQSLQDDFWIGIYNPNVYDQFKKIELK